MSDYNFALMGGVFGFLLVLFIQLRRLKLPGAKFIDVVVLSFLLASTIGFVGTFLGGQIYGRPTTLPIGIVYHHSTMNPYTTAVFPLALMYALAALILGVVLYILRSFVRIDGFVGYIGMALFSAVLLGGEVYRGSDDMFGSYLTLDLDQIGALILLAISVRGFLKIARATR